MKLNRFPGVKRFCYQILEQTSANPVVPVGRKQSYIDQGKLRLAPVDQHSANRLIIPQNDGVPGLRVNHKKLPALRLKLHRNKNVSLRSLQQKQFVRAGGCEEIQQKLFVLGTCRTQSNRRESFLITVVISHYSNLWVN
jgi:hypothetical protein